MLITLFGAGRDLETGYGLLPAARANSVSETGPAVQGRLSLAVRMARLRGLTDMGYAITTSAAHALSAFSSQAESPQAASTVKHVAISNRSSREATYNGSHSCVALYIWMQCLAFT